MNEKSQTPANVAEVAERPNTPEVVEAPRSRRDSLRDALGAVKRGSTEPRLIVAARLARELLPGDSSFGDPLSTAGDGPSQVLGRRVTALTGERPGVVREAGLGALQVWQALSEAQGRGQGEQRVAILFTDLVGFSSWALQAGDEAALELLRLVGTAAEPAVAQNGGRVVKRLGDGLMAVFPAAGGAVAAGCSMQNRLADVEVQGHRPQLRAGVHVGRPRKLGGDYLGVDVNIAARVAEGASGGEVLVSEAARAELDPDSLAFKRQWMFRAKGAPRDLKVYAVKDG